MTELDQFVEVSPDCRAPRTEVVLDPLWQEWLHFSNAFKQFGCILCLRIFGVSARIFGHGMGKKLGRRGVEPKDSDWERRGKISAMAGELGNDGGGESARREEFDARHLEDEMSFHAAKVCSMNLVS